jgi:hypothetical protein
VGARARDALVRDRVQQASHRALPGHDGTGRDVGEGAEHERALVHARMRHRERAHAHATAAE